MFLATSFIVRKTGEPCTQDDFTHVIPALAHRDAVKALIEEYQATGKIVYRSFSLTNNGIETVTLFQNEATHDEFRAEPAAMAFSDDILQVYNQTSYVTDTV